MLPPQAMLHPLLILLPPHVLPPCPLRQELPPHMHRPRARVLPPRAILPPLLVLLSPSEIGMCAPGCIGLVACAANEPGEALDDEHEPAGCVWESEHDGGGVLRVCCVREAVLGYQVVAARTTGCEAGLPVVVLVVCVP
jgi:hypothetical protein